MTEFPLESFQTIVDDSIYNEEKWYHDRVEVYRFGKLIYKIFRPTGDAHFYKSDFQRRDYEQIGL